MGVPEFDSLIAVLVGWPDLAWPHTVIFAFPRVARKIEISPYFKIHTLWQDMFSWIANSLRRLGVLLLFWLPRLWMKHLHLELQGNLSSNMLSGFFFRGKRESRRSEKRGKKNGILFPSCPKQNGSYWWLSSGVPNCTSHTTVLSMGYCQVNQIIVLANLANYNKRKQLNETIKIGNVDTVF